MADNKVSVINEVLKIFNNGWNKQVILYGPPGTSKTYSSTIIAAAMLSNVERNEDGNYTEEKIKEKLKEELKVEACENSLYDLASRYLKKCDNYKLVQFHPSYSYEDFVRGITVKPALDEKNNPTNSVTYEVESKIIEEFCRNHKGKKILVIDEINRAPLASVLGELIYGLEYRNEKISTSYELKDENKNVIDLVIPDDLFIIGTMNTADRSIGSMDYAVRRRFAFVQVGSVESAIESSWSSPDVGETALLLYQKLMDEKEGIFSKNMLEDQELDVEDIKIGHTYFLGKKGEGREYLNYRIEYQIKPIYQEYIKDGMIKKDGMKIFDKIIEEVMNR